eukprot:458919-Pyramimonas_sp.AAC.1
MALSEASRGAQVALLGVCWGCLGLSLALFGLCWAIFGLHWAAWRPSAESVGPSWGNIGSSQT